MSLKQNYFLTPSSTMKKILLSSFFILLISAISSVLAMSIESAPVVLPTSDTSLSIDWDDVDAALGYYIYYGKTSGTEDWYEFEWIDLIESSETVIENLEKDTDYYIAVTVVDENGNESPYSPEAFFSTSNQQAWVVTSNDFALDEVTILSSNELELSFTNIVDASKDAVREFKLIPKPEWPELAITNTSVNSFDPMRVTITTQDDLVEETQYELTVVSMQDIDKNNIEAGIDGINTFVVPRWSTTTYEETEETPVVTVDLESEDIELNAAWVEEETSSKGWETLSEDEVVKTAETAAKDNEALPETGPETVLLFLLAIMLGWGVFFLNARKA